jgi:glycerol kinase
MTKPDVQLPTGPHFILAIDQGTTSSRAIVYNQRLEVVGVGQKTFPQHFPQADWVEHDLEEIWASVESAVRDALKAVKDPAFSANKIVGIGITNQRETFGLWERASGRPVGHAIVWQCRRSAAICEKLKKNSTGKKLALITGLVIDPYFSGTKLKWLLDSSKEIKIRARSGDLAFGTIDTFLMWRLSGGDIFATDVTNASRTLLMDLKSCQWSDFALRSLGVPRELLPTIRDSDAIFGVTRGLSFLPDNIPICGVLGDQQAALFGQACFTPGEAKVTYGTGAFFLLNIGAKPKKTSCGVTTVAWRMHGKTTYALEGSLFIAGAAVQWLRDNLGMIRSSAEIGELAASVPDSDGVFMIPAFSGLGAPDWVPEARGLIGGLTRRSTKAHVARACLEGIASSIRDGFEGLMKDAGVRLRRLRVDGGASMNEILLQSQADLLQTRIQRPQDIESTARGAASIAALSVGLFSQLKELESKNPVVKEVEPSIPSSDARKQKQLWRRRVEALMKGAY